MKEIIGYSAYNTHLEAFEYNEDECFIADSIESLKVFIDDTGFHWDEYKFGPVWMSDILDDYGVSNGRFCMEPEALARFEKAARSLGVIYHIEDYMEDFKNVEVDLSYETYDFARSTGNETERIFSIQELDKDAVVSFSSHSNPFLVTKLYCSNPDCTKDDIFLTFVEKNIGAKSSAAPLAFTISFDLAEGGELNPPKRPEIVSRLADEFMSSLPKEIRANWLKEIRSIKKDLKRIAEYRLDSQDVREGALVSYVNIIADDGSVSRGGRSVSFRFEYEGCEYLVEDMYCSNPKCRCNEAWLMFFELIQGSDSPAAIRDRFMAKVSFDRRMKVAERFQIGRREAQTIMQEWEARYPDAIDLLKERYRQIKEIGKQSLAQEKKIKKLSENNKPVTGKKKIGRNVPCPCGSGKKYKKCCGR